MKPHLMLNGSLCFLGPKHVGWISILEHMCTAMVRGLPCPHLCQRNLSFEQTDLLEKVGMASREGLTSSEWVSRAWASRENFTWKSSVLEERWSDGPEGCEGWGMGRGLGRPDDCAIVETSEAHRGVGKAGWQKLH